MDAQTALILSVQLTPNWFRNLISQLQSHVQLRGRQSHAITMVTVGSCEDRGTEINNNDPEVNNNDEHFSEWGYCSGNGRHNNRKLFVGDSRKFELNMRTCLLPPRAIRLSQSKPINSHPLHKRRQRQGFHSLLQVEKSSGVGGCSSGQGEIIAVVLTSVA
ncbi:hypothetical protein Bbelb_383410 [Branchiostoma belcheri]|nr:hypothetical protein Bbelb_383410 [Branchiostoma belcheri]